MSQYLEEAKKLRNDPSVHYNCAQAVLIPFMEDKELANRITANFGAGMRTGSVCGAITGGLMALGVYGVDSPQIVSEYFKAFRNNHENKVNCADLLKASAQRGEIKKVHCDGMVYEAVELVETILKREGKL